MAAREVLRDARLGAGLSQRELAEKAGIPQPVIARIESGASSPRADTLERLLQSCGRRIASARSLTAVDPQDWAQVEANLRRTPRERLRNLESATRNIVTLRRGSSRG